MRKSLYITVFVLITVVVNAQDSKQVVEVSMTLDDVIELANTQSLFSFRERNMYLARYWEFRSFKADRLPSLGLSASPFNYRRAYENVWNSGLNGYEYVPVNLISSSANLAIAQKIPLTGGLLSVGSRVHRQENLDFVPDPNRDNAPVSFNTNIISLSLHQPLNGYNELKWESRIAPLKFEQAKLDYLQSRETIAIQAVNQFFSVATAEINRNIAEINFANADTLYRIGKGRFEIGTVTQDELLDLELGLLNARLALSRSEVDLRQSHVSLNSFLGLGEEFRIKCVVPYEIPKLQIEVLRALSLALDNNPQMLGFDQDLLEAARRVAETRSQNGISANVNADFGLEKSARDFDMAYTGPFHQSREVRVVLNVPIMDWGVRKGRIEMARSNQEVIEATIKQSLIDFEQAAINSFLDFNLQEEQVAIAAKADTIAQMGFNVTMQRFMIDKVDVIRLNSARNSLDSARRSYINALRRYWVSYYGIREFTLYDFLNDRPLIEMLDDLLQR